MKAFTTSDKYWIYKFKDEWVVILPVTERDPTSCGVRWFRSFQGAVDFVTFRLWMPQSAPLWSRGFSYR